MNVVIITGASSGIGREFALQLDAGLYTVDEFWLIARREERLEELAARLDHMAKVIPMDLTSDADMDHFRKLLKKERPVIRMLINSSGYGMMGNFNRLGRQEQLGMLDINCRALTDMTYACIPYMKRKSRIIMMASSAAFLPQPGFAVYAASKAYVLSLSRALREELGPEEIYVTAVCPGPVRTEFFEKAERRKPYETGREHGADAFILEVMNEGGKGLNKKLGELVLGGDDVFLLGRIDRGALTW